MHRFFLNTEDVLEKGHVTLKNQELIHQLTKVLRFKPNSKLILINQDLNQDIVVELTEISKKEIQAKILETRTVSNLPVTKINLHFAFLKSLDKIELILQKCTEVGVFEFTPIITERTQKKVLPKPERLNKIIKEASEQSQRTDIPLLNDPKHFKDCLSNTDQLNLIANPYTNNSLKTLNLTQQTINLFIGPEGGFSDHEIQQALQNNFKDFQLGKLILRAETASIVATSQILI